MTAANAQAGIMHQIVSLSIDTGRNGLESSPGLKLPGKVSMRLK
jgi:hypothetical protein